MNFGKEIGSPAWSIFGPILFVYQGSPISSRAMSDSYCMPMIQLCILPQAMLRKLGNYSY